MRQGVDPRQVAVAGCGVRTGRHAKGYALGMCVLPLALVVTLLAGCEPVPMPDAALLKPQPAPRCDAKVEAPRKEAALGGASDAAGDAAVARLRKLDYQAQCYRHAEMIARNRLGRLQASVQDMVRAAKPAPGAAP